ITQATEEGALATKNLADFFGKSPNRHVGETRPAKPERSLPFIAFETAKVASSGALSIRCATHPEVRTMNCENYQDLLSDFVDGSLTSKNENDLKAHLTTCAACAAVSADLQAIVSFCLEPRRQYEPVPNEKALWLRLDNTIDSELAG